MIRNIKKSLKVVEKHVDELPVEHQGNLFSAAIALVALVAIVRVAV